MNEYVQPDLILRIRKRDGRSEVFDTKKIIAAIQKAGEATGEFGADESKKLTLKVMTLIHSLQDTLELTVESVQDIVEEVLLASPYRRTAKAYIIYREQHARIREMVSKADVDLISDGSALDRQRAELTLALVLRLSRETLATFRAMAAAQARFTPASRDGRPVAAAARLTIVFRLRDR